MASTGTESFTIGMHPSQKPLPTQPSMRLAYAPDGTAIYKPVASSPAPGPPFNARANEPFNTNTNEAAYNANTNESGARGPPFNVNTNESGARGPPFNVNTNESGARGPPFNANTNNEGGGLGPAFNANTNSGNEPMMKKKRGRPRKYGPDGGMSLAVVASDGATSAGVPPGFSPGGAPGSGEGGRKSKGGRPLGSSNKKKQLAALGSSGIGFTPHVITVKAGEDVSAKIMAFSQNGPRAICVLSANGAISNVTLRQAATSGGTVTYEGRFEILSLSGSFLVSESVGQRSRTGGLSVSLAGPDGRVLGGSVAGLLTAASPVQVVVGSFIADGKKEKKQVSHPDPISAPVPVMAANVTAGGSSSPSRGTMSESSGGPSSPPNQSTGLFGNNNQQGFANFPWK